MSNHFSTSTSGLALFVLLFCTSIFFTCEKEASITDSSNLQNQDQIVNTAEQQDPIPEASEATAGGCDGSFRPVVVVHGFLASGDTYASQFQRFSSNGYCNSALRAFDWNSTAFGSDNSGALDEYIDRVLEKTGASQVDLVGHSAGGGLCYGYLESSANAVKVAHYVHLASSSQAQPAGPNAEIPTLNISSTNDETTGVSDISGAENLTLSGYDHYEVATCAETFAAMYNHFNDEQAITTDIVEESAVSVCGKALTLGENAPLDFATVEVYEVDPATGQRISSQAQHTLLTNERGYWGPIELTKGAPYEFLVLSGNAGDRPVHYYREGFTRSNPLVYLRTLPPATSIAGLLLANLPSDDAQAVVGLFTSSQAVVSGRDDLFTNSEELSIPDFTSADQTTIAMFLYDDGDGSTSLDPDPTFSGIQFLNAVDMFFAGDASQTITTTFNGRTLNCPAWPSQSDGLIVLVFD